MRQQVIARAVSVLKAKGFKVVNFSHQNSCFDLAASKPGSKLLVKVFSNIDALRPEQASELKRLSSLFSAHALVLGFKAKAFGLKDNLFYERHGLPVLTVSSLERILSREFPLARFFKGKSIVELDSVKLKCERERAGLSFSDLAGIIGVSRETVFRYEQGQSASVENAERLESALKVRLVRQEKLNVCLESMGFNSLFELDKAHRELMGEVFEKIHLLGAELELFSHAPFEALLGNSLLAAHACRKDLLSRKTMHMRKSSEAFSSKGFVLTKGCCKKSFNEVPLVGVEELDSFSRLKDLLEVIRERSGKQ